MRHLDRTKLILAGSLLVSALLYLAGVPFPLVVACVAAGVHLLPVIPVMSSVVGRLFASLLLFFAVFQVAASVQLVVSPQSDFRTPAVVTAVIYLAGVLLVDPTPIAAGGRGRRIVDRSDAAGAIVAALFLLPFLPILLGDDTVARVAQISGGQASDGPTHFSMIAEMTHLQNLNYVEGLYYPRGFHLTVAFLQDAFSIPQTGDSWRGAVFVYIGQYLFFGVLMAGAIGYFLSGALRALAHRDGEKGSAPLLYAASIATGVVSAVFVLLPFVSNGFLNYFYALAVVLVAFAVLLTGPRERLGATLALYLVFTFGAGLSWPLLLPPLLATLAFFLCRRECLQQLRSMPKRHLVGLAALFALQFLPVVFQFVYSDRGASQGINLLGALRAFHPLSLLLGALVVVGIAVGSRIPREAKDRSVAIVVPLLAFTGLLALMQLFMVGEVRYYVIKVAFLLEAVNVVFVSCLAAALLSRMDMSAVARFFTAAVAPAAVVLAVFALTPDPLLDVRNLFRTEAQQVKPTFFDADLGLYAARGTAGDVDQFNSMLLHYDGGSQKYFAHTQIPLWANMMQYDGDPEDFAALRCNAPLYFNLSHGTATEQEQADLVAGVKRCARLSAEQGNEYVILTDPGSQDAIRAEFGRVARVEIHGQQ